jgi:DNA-binding NarL/FixJ family response regulator
MSNIRKIIIVDDHPIVRHGLKQIITQTGEFEVVAEAEDANEAFRLISELQPDIACIDLSLKGMGGIELIKWIRGNGFKNPILVISMHDEAVYAERALKAGANGYVMKQEAPDTVITAIKAVLSGDVYISASMSQRVLRSLIPDKSGRSGVEKLSDRELQIFNLIGSGMRVQDIAKELGISTKTVETYQANLKHKLGFHTSAELCKYAINYPH